MHAPRKKRIDKSSAEECMSVCVCARSWLAGAHRLLGRHVLHLLQLPTTHYHHQCLLPFARLSSFLLSILVFMCSMASVVVCHCKLRLELITDFDLSSNCNCLLLPPSSSLLLLQLGALQAPIGFVFPPFPSPSCLYCPCN